MYFSQDYSSQKIFIFIFSNLHLFTFALSGTSLSFSVHTRKASSKRTEQPSDNDADEVRSTVE